MDLKKKSLPVKINPVYSDFQKKKIERLMPLRILIITYDWPPRNAISVHRPYSWAKYWPILGAKITILTAVKKGFDEPLDLKLPELHGVNVIEIPYGQKTNVISQLLKLSSIRRLARRIKIMFGKRAGFVIDPRQAWYEAAKRTARKLASQTDVVVSTFGPSAAHLLAMEMKVANPQLRWVADYRDLWSQRHTGDIPDAVRMRMREQEIASVGKYADQIIAVSKDMVEQLSGLLRKPVHLFPNGFDMDEETVRERLSCPLIPRSGPLRIVYTGMIYPGHRDPQPLLDALAQLRLEGELEDGMVTVDFYGDRVEVAMALAKKPEYAPFIRLMGHVTREKALEAQRNAGILLLLESPAPEARGVLTGKLFEYMVSGRPIMCIGSRPEYEIGQVLKDTGTGVVFGPEQYIEISAMIQKTMSGAGFFLNYKPNIQSILCFSRKSIANDIWKHIA